MNAQMVIMDQNATSLVGKTVCLIFVIKPLGNVKLVKADFMDLDVKKHAIRLAMTHAPSKQVPVTHVCPGFMEPTVNLTAVVDVYLEPVIKLKENVHMDVTLASMAYTARAIVQKIVPGHVIVTTAIALTANQSCLDLSVMNLVLATVAQLHLINIKVVCKPMEDVFSAMLVTMETCVTTIVQTRVLTHMVRLESQIVTAVMEYARTVLLAFMASFAQKHAVVTVYREHVITGPADVMWDVMQAGIMTPATFHVTRAVGTVSVIDTLLCASMVVRKVTLEIGAKKVRKPHQNFILVY